MLATTLAFLFLSGQAAAGTIAWNPPAETTAERDAGPADAAVPSAPSPTLPDWAMADPYAWERSQCHPALRGEEAMDQCQARVRLQLKAALGDRLPAGLQPEGISNCRQVSDGSGGYALTCAPEQRTIVSRDMPPPEVCEERPRAVPGGGVTFERTCRPANAPAQEGLSFRLFGEGARN